MILFPNNRFGLNQKRGRRNISPQSHKEPPATTKRSLPLRVYQNGDTLKGRNYYSFCRFDMYTNYLNSCTKYGAPAVFTLRIS